MNSMFYGCKQLTSLDLSKWSIGNITNITNMFYNCIALRSLDISGWGDITHITSMTGLFTNCINLDSIHLSSWTIESITLLVPMLPQVEATSYIYGNGDIDTTIVPSGWEYDNGFIVIVQYQCKSTGQLPTFNDEFTDYTTEETYASSRYTTTIKASKNNPLPTMISFNSNTQLTKVVTLNASGLTTMDSMFEKCTALTDLGDYETWDTSSVTDMSSIFYNATGITGELNLSGWDVSNVTSMYSMFSGASKVTSIDTTGWDTSSVTDMDFLFSSCKSLISIPGIENWDVSKIGRVYNMFVYYAGESLDLSKWNLSSCTSLYYAFGACSNLKSIDLSNCNCTKVTNMSGMFYGCSSLQDADLSGIDASNVDGSALYEFEDMFTECTALETLYPMTNIKMDLDITDTNLNQASAYRVIKNLATVDETKTLTMNTTVYYRLASAQRTEATNKGWTIETVTL